MKKAELKDLIREAIEEVLNEEFAPLGVAEKKQQLDEKTPPNFPKALHDKLLKQYKDDPSKAYATMWKIFYAKNEGHQRVCEMWMAWENKSLKEDSATQGEEMTSQDAAHDEADLSNPEEKKEVELAKQIKTIADELLTMHGVETDADKEPKTTEPKSDAESPLEEKWGVKDTVHPSRKGMFKGKTKADLLKQKANLKKSGPHERGSKEDTKMKQLNFAIRAKSGWKDAK